tara:strand:- start:1068 stop:2273 length:1206 start_codon:yes stop_codon:yes gene_type:complete
MNWTGFWKALTETTEITVIVAVIMFCFVYSLIVYFSDNIEKAQRYARFTPSLLVSIGIFGTFLGIFFSLVDFNVNKVDESIPNLLSGLKVAFGTSIVGLFLSLSFRAIVLYKPHKIKSKDEADVRDLLTKMTEVKDAISADNESSVITQLQKLRTATVDSLNEIKKSFSDFAKEMSQNNVNALIEAVQKVMEDFNAKINDQLGESFKQLNSSVENLVVWQNNYKTHVENLNEQIQTAISGITSSQESLKQISTNMESLPKTTEALKEIITTIQGQIDNLNNQLEAFAIMKEKAVDAVPTIEKNLNDMTESLSKSVSSIENMSSEIRDSVKQSIKETNDALINQIKGLDEQMQKEVTRVIEIMGTKLASLSQKFVNDYTPLTNQLANLINSLSNIKQTKTKK